MEDILTLIIGKNSNLSESLSYRLKNSVLVSSRDILSDISMLSNYKNEKINIIFNNFQPAIQLHSLKSCTDYVTNSILITSMVLDYFRNTSINKIIYTSSSSVYGNNILCKESDELKPMNLHASLKVSNEKLLEKYCIDNSIDYTITRVFNMYGGNDKFSVVSKIINSYVNKDELTIVNNGNAIRDFIHIDDIVDIYSSLLDVRDVNILNLGTGFGSSIKNILDFLTNKGIEIEVSNIFRDELKTSTADIELLQNIVNKKRFIRIEDYLIEELKL